MLCFWQGLCPSVSLLLGWVGLASMFLALTWPPQTLFLPHCPFRTRGGDAFQLLQIMANPKLWSQLHELAKYIIHCHRFPHNITSDQGTHFTAKEVRQQAYAHGIYCSYLARMVGHHTEDPLLAPNRQHRESSGFYVMGCGIHFDTATSVSFCFPHK